MIDSGGKQIVVWDTSAINSLARLRDCAELVAQVQIAYTHWIPAYIFDEVAAEECSKRRDKLLSVCRELKGTCGRVLISPWLLIEAAVRIFSIYGALDEEVLLKTQPEYEDAVDSGVFSDDLAKVQKVGNRENLRRAEDYFTQAKEQFDELFQSGSERRKTLAEVVAVAYSRGAIQRNVQHYCECVLKRAVDWRYAEGFVRAFPSIEAMICAFLAGHYNRSRPDAAPNPAGAMDLLAATYLPFCHKYVSDDRDQQKVFRDVAKCRSLSTEVIWFSGDFKGRFSF